MADIDRLTEQEAERLSRFYADAEKEILEQINKALLKGNQTQYLKGIHANILEIIKHLNKGGRDWAKEAIPRVYVMGKNIADEQLKEAGLKLIAGFAGIHQQAINALAQSALDRMENIGSVVGRRWDDIYRTIQLEASRGAVLGADSWKQAANKYRDQLAAQGVTGFVDKAGRKWNMTTYTRMVGKTVCMEAALTGTVNRAVEHGKDLVKVSDHSKECEMCRPWENKVLSITGKTEGYKTVAYARGKGLFHPNCRHDLSLFIEL